MRQEYHTACHNCHGSCIAIVTVEDGKAVSIRPDPKAPMSPGKMCPKGLAGLELLYHPDRLRYPMKRVGPRGSGGFERISWDEALDILAQELGKIEEKYGMEAVAIAQGTGRHHLPYTARFANALGTPNWFEPGTAQCFFPRIHAGAATFGYAPAADYYSEVNPACMLVWGCNPAISGADGESRFLFLEALNKGTELIVVDPYATPIAKRAKYHLQLRPGTDDALALGFLHVLIFEELYDRAFVRDYCHGFEELRARVAEYPPERVSAITGVPAETLAAAARCFAAAASGSMEWGCAIEHTPNCFQTVRAIALILAVTGNIDKKGGFIEGMHILDEPDILEEELGDIQRAKRLGAEAHKMLAGAHKPFSSAHIPTVFEAMRTGKPYPVRALLLCGNNGLGGFADSRKTRETFLGLDFICSQELFMTPTTRLADLVLPAASWMELDSLIGGPGGAENIILCQQATVEPLGECLPDEVIFQKICQRLGKNWGAENLDEILNQRLAKLRTYPGYENVTVEELRKTGWAAVPVQYEQYKAREARGEKPFNTPTGKVELYSTILEAMGYDPLPYYEEPPESPLSRPELAKEYPLVLTTGQRIQWFFLSENRQMPSLRKQEPYPIVQLHPRDAGAAGIADGDWVWIESPRGRITQKAKVTEDILPGVVNCKIGWWLPEAPEAADYHLMNINANVLTSMEPPFDPIMGTYQLRALLCRVSPNPEGKKFEELYKSRTAK